jgi:hypothetical protein
MGTVYEGTKQREVLVGRDNQVISAVEAKVLAVRFTDSDGQVDVCLAFCFGKEKDGLPGVYVIQPRYMKEMLTIPHDFLKKGIRNYLASQKPAEAPESVDIGPEIDLGEIEGG